jgi:hypothetical protein
VEESEQELSGSGGRSTPFELPNAEPPCREVVDPRLPSENWTSDTTCSLLVLNFYEIRPLSSWGAPFSQVDSDTGSCLFPG